MPSYLRPSPPTRRVASGCLELSVLSSCARPGRSVWRDGNRQKAESCLGDFIAATRVRAASIRRDEEEERERKRHWAEVEEGRRSAEQQAYEDKKAEERLREQLVRWRVAKEAREFTTEVRALIDDAGIKIVDGGSFGEALKWADAFADRIDPLTPVRRDIAAVKAQAASKPAQNTE